MDVTVRDNDAEQRFEVFADGAPAGFAAYHVGRNRIAFTHTQIDEGLEDGASPRASYAVP